MSPRSSTTPRPSADDSPPCRVLIVDDEPAILRIYARALGNYGFTTEGVSDGDQALARLELSPFDAVVSDVHMPNCDGLDLARLIHARYPQVPIIVISGKPAHGDLNRAVSGGAVWYLIKPVMPSVLRSVIEGAVRRRVAPVRVG